LVRNDGIIRRGISQPLDLDQLAFTVKYSFVWRANINHFIVCLSWNNWQKLHKMFSNFFRKKNNYIFFFNICTNFMDYANRVKNITLLGAFLPSIEMCWDGPLSSRFNWLQWLTFVYKWALCQSYPVFLNLFIMRNHSQELKCLWIPAYFFHGLDTYVVFKTMYRIPRGEVLKNHSSTENGWEPLI
jgi:hypothetical protein